MNDRVNPHSIFRSSSNLEINVPFTDSSAVRKPLSEVTSPFAATPYLGEYMYVALVIFIEFRSILASITPSTSIYSISDVILPLT